MILKNYKGLFLVPLWQATIAKTGVCWVNKYWWSKVINYQRFICFYDDGFTENFIPQFNDFESNAKKLAYCCFPEENFEIIQIPLVFEQSILKTAKERRKEIDRLSKIPNKTSTTSPKIDME